MKKCFILLLIGFIFQLTNIAFGATYSTFKVSDINPGIRKNNVVNTRKVAINNVQYGKPLSSLAVNNSNNGFVYYSYPVVTHGGTIHVQHRARKGRVGNPLYKQQGYYYSY